MTDFPTPQSPRRRGSLRRTLLIAFLVLTLVPLVGISAVTIWQQYENSRAQIIDQLISVATLKEAEIKTWFTSLSSDLELLVASPHVRSAMAGLAADKHDDASALASQRRAVREILESALVAGHKFEEVFLMDATGRVIAATNSDREGQTFDTQPFYQQGLEASYVQSPFYSLLYDEMVVFAATPVRDENGAARGVLVGVACLDTLNAIMLERAGLGESGETYLVNADYVMLTEPRDAQSEGFPAVRTQGADAALTGTSGFGFYKNYQYPPVPVVGVYHWIPELRVALLAEQSQAEAFAITYQNIWITLGTVLIVAVTTIGAAILVTRGIATPLARLTSFATRAAKGDLLEIPPAEHDDEIGILTDAFRTMTVQLRELIGSLEERVAVRTAALEAKNAELEQFTYSVSHDLRAPLRGIHNYADFLREDLQGTLDGDQKAYLDGLGHAVHEAEEMVEDLLKLSRLDRYSVQPETIDLGVFLRDLIASLHLPAEVEVVMGEDWPTLDAEPTLLRQIFQNLIDNAVKFNASPHKRVELGWRPLGKEVYTIFVRDNGIGIDPRYHEQVFRLFERLHTREEYEGTGVGLAIVKKAAGKLRGSVRIESEIGKGSTFFVTLPKMQKEKRR